jgi:hypothetical protein
LGKLRVNLVLLGTTELLAANRQLRLLAKFVPRTHFLRRLEAYYALLVLLARHLFPVHRYVGHVSPVMYQQPLVVLVYHVVRVISLALELQTAQFVKVVAGAQLVLRLARCACQGLRVLQLEQVQ